MLKKSQRVAHNSFSTGFLKFGFTIVKLNALGTFYYCKLNAYYNNNKKKNPILSPLTPPNKPSHLKKSNKKIKKK